MGWLFPEKKYKFEDKITVLMRNPAGGIETIKIDEATDFEHDQEIYMVKEPFVDVETGKRYLGYDKGNPIPWFYGDEDGDPSTALMNEKYRSSMISKLANMPPGSQMDIFAKLKQIPPWMFVAILAVIVLLAQGQLGGIIPFF